MHAFATLGSVSHMGIKAEEPHSQSTVDQTIPEQSTKPNRQAHAGTPKEAVAELYNPVRARTKLCEGLRILDTCQSPSLTNPR
jgi:hypothetical protein